MDIKAIIDNIGNIMLYFVPGYITIKTYSRINGRESKDPSNYVNLVYYVVLSFFLTEAAKLIQPLNSLPTVILCVIISGVGAIFAFLIVVLIRRKVIKKVFNVLTLGTIEKTIWKTNIDFSKKRCPNVIVYANDYVYEGRLLQFGESSEDGWLVLDLCDVRNKNQETISSKKEQDEYERVIIPFCEIKHVKVKYLKGDEHYPTWWEEYKAKRNNAQLPEEPRV